MITQLDLHNFKCFEELKLPLQSLTLLAGGNASGKSSIMQALALLHQNMREHERSSRLMLNGGTAQLGMVGDVIGQISQNTCRIGISEDDGSWFEWGFFGERSDMSMRVERVRGELSTGDSLDVYKSEPLRYLLPESVSEHSLPTRLRGLTYLTAERVGPQELYPFDDPQLTPVVGAHGEYAVSILYSNEDYRIEERLQKEEDIPPTLSRQVEAWMRSFFPGCFLEVEPVRRTNALTLGIRNSKETDFIRPMHTGFGLTQVLPIIVASLRANPNDLLLIENPEVHLHPAAQGKMGDFLAQIASTGVQVIIETHSDHILNGIRRAVKFGMLNKENVVLHFLRNRSESPLPQVESPTIDSNGNIDSWPSGFFDQFDHDMNALVDWS